MAVSHFARQHSNILVLKNKPYDKHIIFVSNELVSLQQQKMKNSIEILTQD